MNMKLDNSYDVLPELASASKRGSALGSVVAQGWEQPHYHQYYLLLHSQGWAPTDGPISYKHKQGRHPLGPQV